MPAYPQTAVSKAVWPWVQGEEPPAQVQPGYFGRLTEWHLWRDILINIAVAGTAGAIFFFVLEKPLMARVVWGIGSTVVISALFIPPLFRGIQWLGKMLGLGVANGLTWILLVPFFYIVFVPARIGLGIKGKDPMKRPCPTDQPSYWERRPPVPSLDQYRKQH